MVFASVSKQLALSSVRSTAALLVGLCPFASAQDTPPPTIEQLQTQIDELKKLSDSIPRTGGSASTMKIFGRTHLDFWNFTNSDAGINVFENDDPADDPANRVEFRRGRIGVSGKIRGNMLYKTEIDYGKPEGFAFKDMYFGFSDLPVVNDLLIGQQKRPYGLDHLNSSRYNVFIERPFMIEAVNQDARRLGVVSYGTDEDQEWNWRYGAFNMVDIAQDGQFAGDTFQGEVAGRLANTFWWENDGKDYAHWAVSGTVAFPDSDPSSNETSNQARFRTRPEARSASRWLDTGGISDVERYFLLGLEGVANFGPTQIVAEWMNVLVQRDGASEDVTFPGGYLYVSHFLTGEHMPWSRKSGTLGRPVPNSNFGSDSGWGALQVAARYSVADFSDQDVFGGEGQSLTLGLNWYWNSHAGLQLNWSHGDISDRNETVGATTFTEGDYDILGLRFRVDF